MGRGVPLALCLRFLVSRKGFKDHALHTTRLTFEGKREFKNLNSHVAKWVVRGELVLYHIQTWLGAAEIEKVAIRDVLDPTLRADLLLDVEVDATRTE